MLTFLKLSLLCLTLTLQGCQLLSSPNLSAKVESTEAELEQDQIHRLLRQGIRYDTLSTEERHVVCKRLKLDYQEHEDWQTAWLLIYSLNKNFDCINAKQTLILLKTIHAKKDFNLHLQWLNNNQIQLLNKLNRLQSRNNLFQRKNNSLKSKLNEAEVQLQDVISKIQALKIIETTINQKTQ